MGQHFTAETFKFLADLGENNSKDWFEANRDRYEAVWKGAALSFIGSISDRMSALDPPLKAIPKLNKSLRRINRDVRFSKDKSPYNATLHMIFWTGDHPNRSPAMHLSLGADYVGYGTGLYGLTPDQVTRYRDMVSDPVEFKGLLAALDRAASVKCTIGEPDLARLPKGYEVEGRAAELIRYKAVVARTRNAGVKPAVLMEEGAEDWVMTQTEALLPLMRWLSLI